MSFVLDANVVGSFLLPDEQDERAADAFERLGQDTALVTQNMPLEVVTVLLRAVRRKRITESEYDEALQKLRWLMSLAEVDSATAQRATAQTAALARRHQLSAYDAAYLELAQRRGVPLATLDTRLVEAARAENVALVGAT